MVAKRKKIRLPLAEYRKGYAFYVTICTHERSHWFERHPGLAKECCNLIMELANQRRSELYAWCVMPDHVHLLIQDRNLIGLVRLLKGKLAAKARQYETDSPLWQRSFFDRGLRDEQSNFEVAKYIWENPVRLGLALHPDEYPWSGSLTWPDWREEFGRG